MNETNYQDKWMYTPKKINVGRGISYGLTDLMGGGWNNIVSGIIFTFLMAQGLNPAYAGAVTGIGRIVDAIGSLLIGSITDNFHKTALGKRFGRRHFIFGVGIIAFAISFPLFWLSVDSALYYILIYCLIEIVIAFILIAWETLPTEMTDDYKLRTILSGSRMIISATGTSIVFFVLFILKQADNPNAYIIAGLAYTIVFVVGMTLSWRLTWERPLTAELIAELDDAPKLSLKKILVDYFSTFKVKAFRKHLSVYIFSFTGKDFFQTMLPTFAVYALFLDDQDPWLFNAMAFVGIFASILAAFLMVKFGPRFLFTSAYSFIFVVLIAFVVLEFADLPRESALPIFIGLAVAWHVGRQTLEFTPWNVFPFIPDVDYIMTRESRAGIYAAVMTFFRKSTGALAAWIAGILLQMIQFKAAPAKICSLDSDILNLQFKAQADCEAAGGKWKAPGAAQIHEYAVDHVSSAMSHNITWLIVLGTGVLILIALIVAQSFRLNRHTHGILKDEIHRLENGGSKADASPETIRVVEALTGHPYAESWPER